MAQMIFTTPFMPHLHNSPQAIIVYMLVYNGTLNRAQFVDEFGFRSEQWKACAQRYAEEIVANDKDASVIGFYLPGSGYSKVFLEMSHIPRKL